MVLHTYFIAPEDLVNCEVCDKHRYIIIISITHETDRRVHYVYYYVHAYKQQLGDSHYT